MASKNVETLRARTRTGIAATSKGLSVTPPRALCTLITASISR